MAVAALRAGALTGLLNQSSAQVIDGSLTFDDDKSQHLKRTFATGNRRTWTWSGWVKRTEFGSTQGRIFGGGVSSTDYFELYFPSGDELRVIWYSGGQTLTTSTAKFRDTGWYHIVLAVDTTLSTGSDRIKMYVNGDLLARDSTTPSEDYETTVNKNVEHNIGKYLTGSANSHFDGKITNTYLIDGQALGPRFFAFTDPLTGTWRPKRLREGDSSINDGTVWSDGTITGTSGGSAVTIIQPERAFNGNFVQYARFSHVANDDSIITWTPPGGSILGKQLRIWCYQPQGTSGANQYLKINNGPYVIDSSNWAAASANTEGWSKVQTIPGGVLTSVSLKLVYGGASNQGIYAIEIDGEDLRDTAVTAAFGTNSFYLPLDGNSPIGKDKSGKGNDFTPVNFGGSNTIEKATGGLPILNTVNGGNVAIPGTRTDANASSIVMAIPFLGTSDDISSRVRGSGSNLTVTTSGSPYADNDPTQWYGSSFNVSTSNYIDAIGTTSTFAFLHQPEAAGTVEGWINTNAINNQGPWFQTSNGTDEIGLMIRQNSNTNMFVQINRGVSGQAISVSGDVTVAHGRWYHWALVKSADGYAQFFLNGHPVADKVAISSGAGATNAASTSATSDYAGRIGRNHGENRGVGANICDYRAYTIQKYAFDTPFIPASPDPDILPDTPSGISDKSELTKITEGAVAFDASGDYLSLADNSDFAFGTGDFTAECFIYPKGNVNYRAIIDCRDQVSDPNGWILGVNAADQIYIYTDGFLLTSADGNTVTTEDQWYHVAYVRNSGTHKLYVDGKEVDSSSTSIDYNTDNCVIGASYAKNSEYWNGFISNVRLVKGTAVYTSDFTPPTEPLTNVTNTKLLCCQSNTEPGGASVAPKISGINDGTQWSIGGFDDPNWDTSHPIERGFNGLADYGTGNVNMARPKNENVTATWNAPGGGIPFTTLKLRAARDATSTKAKIRVNGVDVTSQYTSNSSVLATKTISGLSGISSPLTKIELTAESGQAQPRFSAIYIDDVMLVDPLAREGNAAATTFNPFNTDINTVRGQETGYATYNPPGTSSNITLSNGNLSASKRSSAGHAWSMSTLSMSPNTGKYYIESTLTELRSGGANITSIGLCHSGGPVDGWIGTAPSAVNHFNIIYNNGSTRQIFDANVVTSNYLTPAGAFTVEDVFQIAYDSDNKVGWFGINGFWYKADGTLGADPSTGSNPTWVNFLYDEYFFTTDGHDSAYESNFGQKPYKFPPPDGYQPLSFSNILSDTGIIDPTQYMVAIDYTGNGSTHRPMKIGLQPDLVWLKSRESTFSHYLGDSVRGKTKLLQTNSDAGQINSTTGITSFDSDGFTLGNGSETNLSNDDMIAWTWRAGGNKNTFNVDGEGFGSASDVGMNAGGQNSNAYNQSETWSTASAADAKGFDGSMAYDSGATRLYGTSTYHMVLNAATSFRNVTAVRIGTSENAGTVRINGTLYSTTYISAVGLTVTNPPSVVTTIEVLGASGGLQISYIMINGVLLVDNGVTPTNVPSIPSDKCSVGTKNGFSIVQYEGNGTTNQSLAHGLTQAPDFVIIKNMSASYGWAIFHKDSGLSGDSAHNSPEYNMLDFNDSAATNFSEDCIWDVHSHSLRIHRSGNGNWVNTDGSDYIMYSWHSVPGVQKFGIYSGNGESAAHKGPFVELGFRPALVVIKRQNGTGNWIVYDNKRDTYNPLDGRLYWNTTSANVDNSGYYIDFLSNGFKIRGGNNDNYNASSDYIYCAWAEAPDLGLYGSQSTAR